MSSKKIVRGLSPSESKSPRFDSRTTSSIQESPVWQLSNLDIDGQWGWGKVTNEVFFS